MALKLNYKEVIEYFDEVSPDMAELVLGMIQDRLDAKKEKRAKISANLKKARAARGSKPTEVTTTAQAGNPVIAEAPARRPGRPRNVETTIHETRPVHDANQALVAEQ